MFFTNKPLLVKKRPTDEATRTCANNSEQNKTKLFKTPHPKAMEESEQDQTPEIGLSEMASRLAAATRISSQYDRRPEDGTGGEADQDNYIRTG